MLAGLAFGLGLSAATRWGAKQRRARRWSAGVGFNLAALALLGGILAVGTEPGGLGARWLELCWPAGIAAGVGLLSFRFPRSVGLPSLIAVAVGVTLVSQALSSFRPLQAGDALPLVQPLTDRETVTAFAWRTDVLEAPVALPFVPDSLYRIRPGDSEPPEWWWTLAASRGWAHSFGAPIPEKPLKFGLYRLVLNDQVASWRLEKPELSVPEEGSGP